MKKQKWIDGDFIDKIIERNNNYDQQPMLDTLNSLGIPTGTSFENKDFSVFQTRPHVFEKTIQAIKSIHKDFDISTLYRINSYGLRSEEFTDQHHGKHLLFAGCSVTAGEGMFEKFIWPRRVYDKISEIEKTSGYFNIATPGASIIEIVAQVFKYIDRFGNPNEIFICLPDVEREYVWLSSLKLKNISSRDDIVDIMGQIDVPRVNAIIFNSLKSLDLYCKSNSIGLHMFSWSDPEWPVGYEHWVGDPRVDSGIVKTFSFGQEVVPWIDNFEINKEIEPYKNYIYKAFDDNHPGIGEQDFYFNYAYGEYLNKASREMIK